MKAVLRCAVVSLAIAMLAGCSSFQHKKQMDAFNVAYNSGDFERALLAVSFRNNKNKPADTETYVLELLHQGELYRLLGRYQQATDTYDLAEQGMKYLDTENMAQRSAAGFMAVLVNDSERDYQALMSEAILVNTYKALAFLAVGNAEFARVEFNRADDRTRRAVDFFSKEIAGQREALNSKTGNARGRAALVRDSLGNQQLQRTVAQHYGVAAQWSVLPEFIVPASTYLHGLYFLANAGSRNDYEKAADSLKRVAAMNLDSAVLQGDAALAEALASGTQPVDELAPQVWVVYENGLGPVLEEARLDVPLLLFDGNQQGPAYSGIALPQYRERAFIPGRLGVAASSGKEVHTERISDMGSVIRTEMNARFPGVLARAVSSAVIKAVIQNEAAEQFGAWGQLGAAALTVITTQADLRSWQALPDHWQAVRLERPADGKVLINDAAGNVLGAVAIPQQPFTLIYIKRPTTASTASVVVLDLQGRSPAQAVQLPRSVQ